MDESKSTAAGEFVDEKADAKRRRAQHRQSRCVMLLPDDLAGKRVLDICCRSGLGAYKIAERAGEKGLVVGTDPSPEQIAKAEARAAENHWAGDGWSDYLHFLCCDIDSVTDEVVKWGPFDVVVVNSALYLANDLAAALTRIHDVLAPNGFLYHDGVLAEKEPPENTAAACRETSNIFGCAPTRVVLETALAQAGFLSWSVSDPVELEIPAGDTREDLAQSRFFSTLVQAYR